MIEYNLRHPITARPSECSGNASDIGWHLECPGWNIRNESWFVETIVRVHPSPVTAKNQTFSWSCHNVDVDGDIVEIDTLVGGCKCKAYG